MPEEYRIFSFHEKELELLLEKLNLLRDLNNGKLKCSCCDKVITRDNFGGIQNKDGKIMVICDTPLCVEKAVKKTDD